MLQSFCQGTLFGEQFGPQVPLLAFHGWGRSHEDFRDSLRQVGGLAIDLPGFGASPAPAQAWGAAQFANAVAPLLDSFDEPPILVGHSLGGRVALQLALMRPQAVRHVIFIATPLLRLTGKKRRGPLKFRVAKRLHGFGIVGDTTMEHYRNRYGSRDYRNATGVMRESLVRLVNESYESVLADLNVGSTLLWARDDTETPIEIAEKSLPLLTNAELQVLDSGGHMLPTSQPDVVAEVIRKVRSK